MEPRLVERRQRDDGQAVTRACPFCCEMMRIDSREITLDCTGASQRCPACGGQVSVRVGDKYRPAPRGVRLVMAEARWRLRDHLGLS